MAWGYGLVGSVAMTPVGSPKTAGKMNRQVAVITGAAGFIGAAMVRALSEVDCHLVFLTTGNRKIEVVPDSRARITNFIGNIRNPSMWEQL